MPNLEPKHFPHLLKCDLFSQTLMESHLRLYEGYVRKYNELAEKLHNQRKHGPAGGPDTLSLKGDITFALGAIKNHDLFFDCLGEEGEPAGELAEAIAQSFHSVPQYLVELKQTAVKGRGWAWTAYDLDHGTLANYEAGADNGLPVWNAVPILAIDLFGHAYFYDYGNNRTAYVEAAMKGLDWKKIAARFQTIRAASSRAASA